MLGSKAVARHGSGGMMAVIMRLGVKSADRVRDAHPKRARTITPASSNV
jgi:hypothetical protein